MLGAALLVGFQPLGPLLQRGDQARGGHAHTAPTRTRSPMNKNAGNPTLIISPAAGLTSGNATLPSTASSATRRSARPRPRDAAVRWRRVGAHGQRGDPRRRTPPARPRPDRRAATTAPGPRPHRSEVEAWSTRRGCARLSRRQPRQRDRESEKRRVGDTVRSQAASVRWALPSAAGAAGLRAAIHSESDVLGRVVARPGRHPYQSLCPGRPRVGAAGGLAGAAAGRAATLSA